MKFKRFTIKIGAWALMILVLSSCQEIGQEDFNFLKTESVFEKSQLEKDEFQKKLIEVSTVLGVALQDKDAMNELFSFAELEANDRAIA